MTPASNLWKKLMHKTSKEHAATPTIGHELQAKITWLADHQTAKIEFFIFKSRGDVPVGTRVGITAILPAFTARKTLTSLDIPFTEEVEEEKVVQL